MYPSFFDPFHSWGKRVYPSLLFPYIEGSMEKLTAIVFPLCGVVGQNGVYPTLFVPYFGGKNCKRVKIYPNPDELHHESGCVPVHMIYHVICGALELMVFEGSS